MPLTRIELEQIRNNRDYNDTLILGPGAESGIDHSEDFNYTISQLRQIIGEANWYDAPQTNLSSIAAASGTWITDTQLNAALVALSGQVIDQIVESDTWTQVFERGMGILQASGYNVDIRLSSGRSYNMKDSNSNVVHLVDDTNNLSRRLGRREFYIAPANISAGTQVIIPNGAQYTTGDSKYRNLMVFRNGVLLLPGAGNDYTETSISGVTFSAIVRRNDILTFRIFG